MTMSISVSRSSRGSQNLTLHCNLLFKDKMFQLRIWSYWVLEKCCRKNLQYRPERLSLERHHLLLLRVSVCLHYLILTLVCRVSRESKQTLWLKSRTSKKTHQSISTQTAPSKKSITKELMNTQEKSNDVYKQKYQIHRLELQNILNRSTPQFRIEIFLSERLWKRYLQNSSQVLVQRVCLCSRRDLNRNSKYRSSIDQPQQSENLVKCLNNLCHKSLCPTMMWLKDYEGEVGD